MMNGTRHTDAAFLGMRKSLNEERARQENLIN